MIKHTPLPVLLAALLAIHSPAQGADDSKKSKATVKKTAGKGASPSTAAYPPKVKAALSKRWADAFAPRMAEFLHGSLNVTFKLDAEGKVTAFAVVANTSNEPFAKFCEEFVRETAFEKPPASALTAGQLEIPFTFTIL
ncbi:MAG: hypothetical protein ABIP85_25085 [Chthoniobacteraceae bacterium]